MEILQLGLWIYGQKTRHQMGGRVTLEPPLLILLSSQNYVMPQGHKEIRLVRTCPTEGHL